MAWKYESTYTDWSIGWHATWVRGWLVREELEDSKAKEGEVMDGERTVAQKVKQKEG
jgi:hypothetical protein